MLSRSTPSSSMQKTYDDCYLICSTAVYFEKQSNEDEALRSWRSALDAIYYHNAYRIPANYKPKSETERALQDSLRDMELQCKERVDLLEALRKSRDETADPMMAQTPTPSSSTSSVLGSGTVAPVNYPDIAKPPLPQRPIAQARATSSTAGLAARPPDAIRSKSTSHAPPPSRNTPSPALDVPQKKVSRTPSPDKKPNLLRSTLRSGGAAAPRNGASSKFSVASLRPRPPAPASQAATLAWPGAPGSRPLTAVGPPPPPAVQRNSIGHAADQPLSPIDTKVLPSRSRPGLKSPTNSAQRLSGKKPRDSGPGLRPSSQQPSSHPAGMMPPPPPPHREPVSAGSSSDHLAQSVGPPSPLPAPEFPSYRREYAASSTTVDSKMAQRMAANLHGNLSMQSKNSSEPPSRSRTPERKKKTPPPVPRKAIGSPSSRRSGIGHRRLSSSNATSTDPESEVEPSHHAAQAIEESVSYPGHDVADADEAQTNGTDAAWDARVKQLMKNLPKGVDEQAAKAIFNEVVIQGDEVHWDDVAGLDIAKSALKEAVVYPFLRPDLFRGLREPARGMLLFGPPGTGKTMLARAVATESKSTFFAISASSLTSKYLGESEKLVRALFSIAKVLTPSIIFVDEIDSLLSARSGSGEHEATRRIKTEFLIQWSDLAKAAAGRDDRDKSAGDASRVLVLAATNLPWAIDEAARRRFVRRQYIPLPEAEVRASQLQRLLSAQKTSLAGEDLEALVQLTDGYSGSDITALAKDAAMGPLRSLGEKLLHMTPEDIRPISMEDFEASLVNIRPSVSNEGLQEYEDWARQFGERGG